MFSTSFSGGWDAYSKRESVVSANNKARQKSQRISDATAGKKKKRKPENKGKHRKQEAVIKGSGDVKQTAPLGGGGSASQNVVVFPAKAKNRAGAGRPPKSFKSYGNTDLDSAFKDRYLEKQQKKEETEVVRQRREAREDRVRQEDIDERRRERGERQRQFNIQQQAEARREQQRQIDRANEIAREQAREVARERREDAREVARQEERAEELRIREMEARGRLEVEERIARQQLRPLIEQGAISLSNIGNPNIDFSNIGNPVVNVGGLVGDDPATRRRQRGRGGGGGGRRSYDSSDDSSGGDSGGGGSQLPTPSPRSRREQQRSSATSRRGGRTPRPAPTQQPTTPEEEASLLGDVASGVASGVSTIGGGLVRAGGGFIGGVGGAIAEQLPSAETIGNVAGRGAVALAGATGRGAISLVSEAIRPAQQEVEADPSLLQSVSEGESSSGAESLVVEEAQQPVSTLAQRLAERQAQQQRELQQQQEEEERQRRIREQRRRETQKRAEQGEQAGILADIQSGAGRVAGAVSGAVSLVADALRTDTPPQQRPVVSRRELGEEELTSGGEEAPQILIKTDEPLASFRETYVGTGDISESDDERRRRAEREQIEKEDREEYERQTSQAPTPAQVKADVESGTEGIFRQLDRIVKTGGDVLEDPVEQPLSPKAIEEASARRLKKQPAPEPERVESDVDVEIKKTRSKTKRPIVVLERGKPFIKPSNQKTTKSEDVIKEEYRKLGVDVAFTSRKSGGAVNIKDVEGDLQSKGYAIYQRSLTPPPKEQQKKAQPKKAPPKPAESESELSTDTEEKFRDLKKLSPKQLVKTAETLQKQQQFVDKKLTQVEKIIQQKDRQIVNLSQRALLLDTEQSGGGESDFSSGAESEGRGSSGDSSAGEYDLRRYGRREESEGSGSGGSGGGLLEGDDY